MESGNSFLEARDEDASQGLNVLVVYENLTAGQRAMRLCRDLTVQQQDGFTLQPRFWRLDLIADAVCGGFAIADAVQAELVIVSTSSQAELPKPAQHWLKLCLAVARKGGTCAAVVALLATNEQFNEAYFSNLQFLRSLAQEAGVEFFAPFANRKQDVRAKVTVASEAHRQLGGIDAPAAWPIAQARQFRAYGGNTNYREWGIND